MLKLFPPHMTDYYKTGHIAQFPDHTQFVYSNFTCRSDKHANVLPDFDHKVVAFGFQGVAQWLLCDLWNENFFKQPREKVVARYKRRMDSALGPDCVDAENIGKLHDLGYLPVRIKAVPEGSRVDIRTPMWTIINTLPEFYWVTNYLETQLSAEMWKMITSATTAYEYRRLLDQYANETGSSLDFVPWQGHDFSMRGMAGTWDATQSGAAHLLSFTGTDTISSIDYLEDYYSDPTNPFIGGSVPATEHSVMTMGGEENEVETFKRLIQKIYPSGIVSIVSDSWDFWQVITKYTVKLKNIIMNRPALGPSPGKVVFRPDSGNPYNIIVGDPEAEDGSPEQKGAVQCLWEVFGGTVTNKGYKTLDSHVGLIYGDSISVSLAHKILEGLKQKGFSSGNIVFGIGSFTYQFVTRDSYGTAIKATFGVVDGIDREIFKNPKTDSGMKKSAKGLIRVENEDGTFILYDQQTREQEKQGILKTIFEDGKVYNLQTLSEIRNRLLRN